METQPREPETRANVAAWVTYAASLSDEERGEHLRQCAKIDEREEFITSCPLCNAIWKERGMNRTERRECRPKRMWRPMKHASIAKRAELRNPYDAYTSIGCPSDEDRAIRRHAIRLIEEALADARLGELVEEYGAMGESLEESAEADLLRGLCEAIEVHIRLSLANVYEQHWVPRAVYSHAKRRRVAPEEAYMSDLQLAWLSVLACMAVSAPPETPHYFVFSIVALWRLDTTMPADKSNTSLVVSMKRAPRAPQSSPFSGSNKAVAAMGI